MKFAKRGKKPTKSCTATLACKSRWFPGKCRRRGDAVQLPRALAAGGPGGCPGSLILSRGALATDTHANGPSRGQNASHRGRCRCQPCLASAGGSSSRLGGRAGSGHPTGLGVPGAGGNGAVATGTGRDRPGEPQSHHGRAPSTGGGRRGGGGELLVMEHNASSSGACGKRRSYLRQLL